MQEVPSGFVHGPKGFARRPFKTVALGQGLLETGGQRRQTQLARSEDWRLSVEHTGLGHHLPTPTLLGRGDRSCRSGRVVGWQVDSMPNHGAASGVVGQFVPGIINDRSQEDQLAANVVGKARI